MIGKRLFLFTGAAALLALFAASGAARAEEASVTEPPAMEKPVADVAWADAIERLLALRIDDGVELCGQPVPLEREDVRERLELEVLLILGNPAQTALWIKRMPRHFPMIEAAIAEAGLPADLKYVAVVESSLRPDALSRAGAAGPWQFMRGTGKQCGLDQDRFVDERRDWEKSTQSALAYLRELQGEFGDWALAMAAYNLGKGRLKELMGEQGESDYYGLLLPNETERYVFRVMAVKLIVENPERFGLDFSAVAAYPADEAEAVAVEVKGRPLPLAVLAEAGGVSYRYLVRLNPWLSGPVLPAGRYEIRLPGVSGEAVAERVAAWEKSGADGSPTLRYKVRSGDTLTSIARRHDVALGRLLTANGLSGASIIRPGQELLVPLAD